MLGRQNEKRIGYLSNEPCNTKAFSVTACVLRPFNKLYIPPNVRRLQNLRTWVQIKRGDYRVYRYEGDFLKGEMHGRGRYLWSDGGHYEASSALCELHNYCAYPSTVVLPPPAFLPPFVGYSARRKIELAYS